jgi:hypothetical protein
MVLQADADPAVGASADMEGLVGEGIQILAITLQQKPAAARHPFSVGKKDRDPVSLLIDAPLARTEWPGRLHGGKQVKNRLKRSIRNRRTRLGWTVKGHGGILMPFEIGQFDLINGWRDGFWYGNVC